MDFRTRLLTRVLRERTTERRKRSPLAGKTKGREMTKPKSDSEMNTPLIQAIVDSMVGKPLEDIVAAISKVTKLAFVTDDGEIPMSCHTRAQMDRN